jgi:hypothetical protein
MHSHRAATPPAHRGNSAPRSPGNTGARCHEDGTSIGECRTRTRSARAMRTRTNTNWNFGLRIRCQGPRRRNTRAPGIRDTSSNPTLPRDEDGGVAIQSNTRREDTRSRSGRSIVLRVQPRRGGMEIFVICLEGTSTLRSGDLHQVHDVGIEPGDPTWSPRPQMQPYDGMPNDPWGAARGLPRPTESSGCTVRPPCGSQRRIKTTILNPAHFSHARSRYHPAGITTWAQATPLAQHRGNATRGPTRVQRDQVPGMLDPGAVGSPGKVPNHTPVRSQNDYRERESRRRPGSEKS